MGRGADGADGRLDGTPVGTLSAIWIHPVKSCRRVPLTTVEVSSTGLAGDRMWQVVDADGAAVTQRTRRQLALVDVEPADDGALLLSVGGGTGGSGGGTAVTVPPLRRPGADTGTAAGADTAAAVTVRSLTGDEVDCADAGDEAAAFFSDVLGEPARLVGFTDATRRPSKLFRGHDVSFADAAPVVVANTASVRDLERRAGVEFGVERFRPNLVVDTRSPWAEDAWDRFAVGPARLAVRVPWPRCAVPQIDQDSGDRTAEPAVVLRRHRWCDDASAAFPDSPGVRAMLEGNALFGVGCAVGDTGATLTVGDPVVVESVRPPVLAPPPATR
ncbi:MAG TPA: hypothetical protein DEP66_00475 [Acidimicrobiaceae bacterium]|nr:hypothetical protein [Acidimicrobiaceae bacterium]HCB36721.1 hypothetical protein [Acidimicrobiaceae bacterium]